MSELISMRRRDGSKGNLKIVEWITSRTYTQCEKFAHKLLVDNLTVKNHIRSTLIIRKCLFELFSKGRWAEMMIRRRRSQCHVQWEALVQCAQDAGLDVSPENVFCDIFFSSRGQSHLDTA